LAERDRLAERARPVRFPVLVEAAPGPDPAATPVSPARAPAVAAPPSDARRAGWEEGRRAGFDEGRRAALAEWNARLGAAAAALEGAARALAARRLELAAEVERRLPALVLRLAEKVLAQELRSTERAVHAAVLAVAARLAGLEEPVTVRLHPDALEAFEAWRRQAGADPAGVRVEADPALGLADWTIETRDGFLDGRVSAQLEAAWALLEEAAG
jgi:flagellar assembly protein FliH